jgi:hypothetical protein
MKHSVKGRLTLSVNLTSIVSNACDAGKVKLPHSIGRESAFAVS